MKIKGHITAGVKETHVTYTCIKCGQEKSIVIRPLMTERQASLYADAIEEKLCLSCLCGTDSRIEGAAENLCGLLM